MSKAKHTAAFESEDISIAFWIFPIKESLGGWLTLLHKGNEAQDLTPTIMMWPRQRKLHVRASTEVFWNEGLDSKSTLQLRRWSQVTAIFSKQLIQLFINGVLDNQAILKGSIKVIINSAWIEQMILLFVLLHLYLAPRSGMMGLCM
jgi:hypothetical protein